MGIEDKMFYQDLRDMKLRRTKNMYERASLPHTCRMCDETSEVTYKLKMEYVTTLSTPYIFICEDCYKELKDE